ncbi:MAG TPA: hypothetical protein VKU94_06800 [Geobacterales bacterium]|nr:hypothetical protein [Geobacterales bacterium]
MAYQNLFRGTLISTFAALLIFFVLLYLVFNGISSVTNLIPLSLMYILFILAIWAYIEYRKLPMPHKRIFNLAIPSGLAIVFAGLILLSLNRFEGAYLIVIGYLSEPIGGIAPFSYYMMFDRKLGAFTYTLGAIYVLALPLFIINLGLISLVADGLKLIGFVQLYRVVSNSKFDIEGLRIKTQNR